jgi:hypothetical protein
LAANSRLKFSDGHLDLVRSGAKKITLRLYRPDAHDYKNGQKFLGVFPPNDYLCVLRAIADTELFPANSIPDDVAKEDGFSGGSDAYEGLKKYYGDQLKADSTIACIRFAYPA